MHPWCREEYERRYWRERPARERARRDALAPALEPLVQLLSSPRGRAKLAQFAAWAQVRARGEYGRGAMSGPTIRGLNAHFDMAELLAELADSAAPSTPSD